MYKFCELWSINPRDYFGRNFATLRRIDATDDSTTAPNRRLRGVVMATSSCTDVLCRVSVALSWVSVVCVCVCVVRFMRGWRGRTQDASLLSLRRHRQHGVAHGVQRRRSLVAYATSVTSVCPSVCNVGGLRSLCAIKSGYRRVTG